MQDDDDDDFVDEKIKSTGKSNCNTGLLLHPVVCAVLWWLRNGAVQPYSEFQVRIKRHTIPTTAAKLYSLRLRRNPQKNVPDADDLVFKGRNRTVSMVRHRLGNVGGNSKVTFICDPANPRKCTHVKITKLGRDWIEKQIATGRFVPDEK